jgi:hypothetical protein
MDQLVDAQRPLGWDHAADSEMLVHSWLDGLFGFGKPVWYAEWTGQLGLAWVLLLLPAIVALTVPALMAKRYRVAAFAVVLPILAGTLASPGSWFSRYTIPVLIAGAVAFAVLCGSGRPAPRPAVAEGPAGEASVAEGPAAQGPPGRWTARPPWLAVPRPSPGGLAALLVVALAGTAVFGTAGVLRWSNYRPEEDPVARDYRETAALLLQPAGARARSGLWKEYAELDAIPRDSRIAFCAQDPPSQHAPFLLIGRDFGNVLVDLGVCRNAYAARVAMERVGADYLFASDRTTMGRRIKPRQDEFGLKRITSATQPVGGFGVFHVYHLVGPVRPEAELPLPPPPQAAPVPAGAPRPPDKRTQPKLPAFSAAAVARSPEYSRIRPDSGLIGCEDDRDNR